MGVFAAFAKLGTVDVGWEGFCVPVHDAEGTALGFEGGEVGCWRV